MHFFVSFFIGDGCTLTALTCHFFGGLIFVSPGQLDYPADLSTHSHTCIQINFILYLSWLCYAVKLWYQKNSKMQSTTLMMLRIEKKMPNKLEEWNGKGRTRWWASQFTQTNRLLWTMAVRIEWQKEKKDPSHCNGVLFWGLMRKIIPGNSVTVLHRLKKMKNI